MEIDFSQLLQIAPLLTLTGIIAGLLAGLLGVGGGIVIVPVLYFVFQSFGMEPLDAMKLATGTSLAAIIPTSISSMRAHHKKGNIQVALIKDWIIWMLLGVLIGATVLSTLQSNLFTLLFALIAGWVSLRMFFKPASVSGGMPSTGLQRLTAGGVGSLSVMVGIGGGTLGVPVLSKYGLKAHHAVGTAAAFGLIIALPGALMMFILANTPAGSPVGTLGAIHLPSLLLIVPLTVLLAPVGVKLGHKLNPDTLKRVFAVVLFITSIRMLTQTLGI